MEILQFGVLRETRDFNIWNTLFFQYRCTGHHPQIFVEVYRLVLEQPMKFDFSKVLNSGYGVSLNLNLGQ
jgi:hypothetical protein